SAAKRRSPSVLHVPTQTIVARMSSTLISRPIKSRGLSSLWHTCSIIVLLLPAVPASRRCQGRAASPIPVHRLSAVPGRPPGQGHRGGRRSLVGHVLRNGLVRQPSGLLVFDERRLEPKVGLVLRNAREGVVPDGRKVARLDILAAWQRGRDLAANLVRVAQEASAETDRAVVLAFAMVVRERAPAVCDLLRHLHCLGLGQLHLRHLQSPAASAASATCPPVARAIQPRSHPAGARANRTPSRSRGGGWSVRRDDAWGR